MVMVLIEPSTPKTMEAWRAIALDVCNSDKPCFPRFWTDPVLAPSQLPMTDAQVNGMQAAAHVDNGKIVFDCNPFMDRGRRCAKL